MPVAEAVAVVASVIAIIQISDRTISSCKFYIQSASETPSELRAILIEISSLRAILDSLRFLDTYAQLAPSVWKQLAGNEGSLEECKRLLLDLEKLFPRDDFRSSVGAPPAKRAKLIRASLAWPLKSHRARYLLQSILQQKTNINLALSIETLHHVKQIKEDTSQVRSIVTDSHRRGIYRWLESTDTSGLHNRATQLHEQDTCDWVLRLPDWKEWLTGDCRCLWIHGIPGAGKTVLASFLIERVKDHCRSLPRAAHTYYYCYFGHNQDEADPFLRWTIAQLCRQAVSIPEIIIELHKHGRQPSLSELLLALESCLETLDSAYVVLDAADESKPRGNLLKVLRDLASDPRFSKLHVIVTSRDYVDIEQALDSVSQPVPMDNALIAEDIRRFVRASLHSGPRFPFWPANLIAETEEELVSRSKGMFRWVVCQLDRLERMRPHPVVIKDALRALPKTLDETYERIFSEVPDDDRCFTRHVLHWICFHQFLHADGLPLGSTVLLAAAGRSMDMEPDFNNEFEHDIQRLRDVLGCLIHVDQDDAVRFAHYTVREYLDSPRMAKSAVSYFCSGSTILDSLCVQIVLEDAQAVDESLLAKTEAEGKNLDLYRLFSEHYSAYCVITSLALLLKAPAAIASDSKSLSLAAALFNPKSEHYTEMSKISQAAENHGDDSFMDLCDIIPRWRHMPENSDAAIFLQFILCGRKLNPSQTTLASAFKLDKDVQNSKSELSFCLYSREEIGLQIGDDEYDFSGSLLTIVAELSYLENGPLLWMLDQCEELDEPQVFPPVAAYHRRCEQCYPSATSKGAPCLLRLVLDRLEGVADEQWFVTPLQLVVSMGDVRGVQILLEAGADPNGAGDTDGDPFGDEHILKWYNGLNGNWPTRICCTEHLRYRRGGYYEDDFRGIKALLLWYGATDDDDHTENSIEETGDEDHENLE